MPRFVFSLIGFWALLSSAVSAAPALDVTDPWIAEAPPVARVHAGYVSLANPSDRPVRIVAVHSPRYARVEMHRTVVEQGVSRMLRMDEIRLAPGDKVVLEPGGMHLMLFEPKTAVQLGEKVPVRLEFDDGSALELNAEVRQRPMPAHHHSPHGHMQH